MANRIGARQNAKFLAVGIGPNITVTPGPGAIGYPVFQDLSGSIGIVKSVRFNGDPVYVLDQSTQPRSDGDPGKGVGVKAKSKGVSGEVKPTSASGTVRVGGRPVVREGDDCTLNDGNCPGKYVIVPEVSGAISAGQPPQNANPPAEPEKPKEEGWWHAAGPWVHGTLGVASFVPGISLATGAADAAIYAAEGEMVEAGIAAASMIPGGKVVTTAGKAIKMAKTASTTAKVGKTAHAAEEAAKVAREAEEAAKAAKEAAQKAAKEKAEKEAAEDGTKIKGIKEHRVPCFNPFDKAKYMAMNAAEKKGYLKEMAEQLRRQQDVINSMSAIEYKAARDAYMTLGRNPLAKGAQGAVSRDFQATLKENIAKSLKKTMGKAEAKVEATKQAKALMSKLAALHEPDMVAGGWMDPKPKGFGRADVNSSIGGSWSQGGRVAGMDAAAERNVRSGMGDAKMKVKLEVCRGK